METSKMAPRVLIVINSLIQAGAEALVKELAPQLRAHGIHVSVAVLKRLNNSFEEHLEQSGVPLIAPGRAGFYSPRHLLWLRRTMQQFDLVHGSPQPQQMTDRKSTRLNSRHQISSYAVFCSK